MKKKIIFCILFLVVCLIFVFYGKDFVKLFSKGIFSDFGNLLASPISTSTKPALDNIQKQTISKDLGTISSYLGFSLKYPYKEVGAMWGDDESFQIGFFFPGLIVSSNKDEVTTLDNDVNNMHMKPMDITVIKETKTIKNFKTWIDAYSKNEDRSQGKILSKKTSPITFAGLSGYKIVRSVEVLKNGFKIRYTPKQIFVNKNNFVYKITYLSASNDTKFIGSWVLGKKYLERVDVLSAEILKTFVFDGSTTTSITIPRVSAPQLSGEAKKHREELLNDLRKEPFFDNNQLYKELSDKCDSEMSQPGNNDTSKQKLQIVPGIYFSADDKVADLHAYDKNGGHTGLMPKIPGLRFSFPEEMARGFEFHNMGSDGGGLIMDENVDAKIELVGKDYDFVRFGIRGDGNGCGISSIFVPVTPYSVGILPLTLKGDIGPFSYDIDGDGKQDFVLSLLHPLLPEKQMQVEAVMADMKIRDSKKQN